MFAESMNTRGYQVATEKIAETQFCLVGKDGHGAQRLDATWAVGRVTPWHKEMYRKDGFNTQPLGPACCFHFLSIAFYLKSGRHFQYGSHIMASP